jgi:hypothetical protein
MEQARGFDPEPFEVFIALFPDPTLLISPIFLLILPVPQKKNSMFLAGSFLSDFAEK